MCEDARASEELALRREARRRKILENSESRLKLIEGGIVSLSRKSSSETTDRLESEEVAEGESVVRIEKSSDKSKIESKFEEAIKQNEELNKISDYLLQKDGLETGEVEEEEAETESKAVERQEINSLTVLLMKKKLHYIILALAVNVLLHFNLGHLFYENIFCPFYTMRAIEFMLNREEKEDLQPFLFILLAGLPKAMQKSARFLLSAMMSCFSDLFLYIFTFIIGTKILSLQV